MISGSLAAAECHAHINAHKPPKPVTPTFFMPDKNLFTTKTMSATVLGGLCACPTFYGSIDWY